MTTGESVRLVLLVLPLGLDTLALSTVLGVTPLETRTRVRLALTFAAAEGLMPAIGLLLGLPLGTALGSWSGYVAGVLLCGLGTGMWWKERRERDEDNDAGQGEATKIALAATASGWGIVGLAVSISLDELVAGFSFGVLRVPIIPAVMLIVLQALLVSVAGQWVGRRLGQKLGERAERLIGPAFGALGLCLIAAQVFGIP